VEGKSDDYEEDRGQHEHSLESILRISISDKNFPEQLFSSNFGQLSRHKTTAINLSDYYRQYSWILRLLKAIKAHHYNFKFGPMKPLYTHKMCALMKFVSDLGHELARRHAQEEGEDGAHGAGVDDPLDGGIVG
jgi:hypothetical protein